MEMTMETLPPHIRAALRLVVAGIALVLAIAPRRNGTPKTSLGPQSPAAAPHRSGPGASAGEPT
jgi:hypothetical protein